MSKEAETVENQKVIIVSKAPADKDHPYSVINLSALDHAASILTANDFKLWVYIAKNQNKYNFALSRADFCRWSGASKNTYFRAVQSLIEKGYLVQKENGSNIYIFYEEGTSTDSADNKMIEFPQKKVEESIGFDF